MGSSAEEIRRHQKVYIIVFATLAALTCVTVAIAQLDLGVAAAVTLALIVAVVKGSLVACYFMHLLTERGMIIWILALTVLFFVVLLVVPAITHFEPHHANPAGD